MFSFLGIKDIDELYRDIPALFKGELNIPSGLSELEVKERLTDLSQMNKNMEEYGIFRGAGIYNHYIPSVIYPLASNRNFLTAYTPYQAEVSQGTSRYYMSIKLRYAILRGWKFLIHLCTMVLQL